LLSRRAAQGSFGQDPAIEAAGADSVAARSRQQRIDAVVAHRALGAMPEAVKVPLLRRVFVVDEFAAVVTGLVVVEILDLAARQRRLEPDLLARADLVDGVERGGEGVVHGLADYFVPLAHQ